MANRQFYVLVIISMAICDGIIWLQVARKPSDYFLQRLFAAIILLVGIVGMSIFLAFNY
jgi:hypothetical protein